jgi:hypothetical protein
VNLTASQQHDVDVVVNDLPFTRDADDTNLILTFK